MHIHEVDTTNLVAFKRSVIYHGQQPMRLVNVHYNHLISGILNIPFKSTRSNTHTHSHPKKNDENNFSSSRSRFMYVCKWKRLQIDWSILNRSQSDTKAKLPYCQVKTAEYSTTSRFFDVNVSFFLLLTQFLYNVQFMLVDFFVIAKKPQRIAGRK